jgi:glucose/arabinose dehydrogenase
VNDPSARGEIWAYGFRNPWRFSFDTLSKRPIVGDVGQGSWEEVDILVKGHNYGWNIMEGRHCFDPPSGCDRTGITSPIAEYSHAEGFAVIGGYVYRGSALPTLRGVYVFGDLNGKIFALKRFGSSWRRVLLLDTGMSLSGFGQDQAGEMYVLDYGSGTVFRIVAQ